MKKAASPRAQVIALTGFMGAGKSTVARALAELLRCPAVDLDELIAAREGRTPQQLIDDRGEEQFRDAETRALAALADAALGATDPDSGASDAPCLVIALGGGAWTLARNRELLEAAGALVVWLDAPFDLCRRRMEEAGGLIGAGLSSRPLARDAEKARRLYETRRAAYALATLRVEVPEEKRPQRVAEEIARAARRW